MVFREGSLPRDQRYEVVIHLDKMTMFLKPSSSGGSFQGELRRLSTESYASCPCDPVATNWKWYWKDNGNVWHMYDKDYSVSLYYIFCLIRVLEMVQCNKNQCPKKINNILVET